DFRLGLRPDAAAIAELAHEMTVLQSAVAERGGADLVRLQEGFDVVEQAHARFIRCDITHRQGVFLRGCPTVALMCDTSHMGEFNMQAFRERLQTLMDAKGIKRKPLAKAAG